jgi:glucose-1-phosphate adenylyltransferase
MRVDTTLLGLTPREAAERPFLASMGIYVFRKQLLVHLLDEELPNAVDFGRDVLPGALGKHNVQAFLFEGYWEDIGTIGAFYRANMELTRPLPAFNFFDAEAPIYTRARNLPGSKLLDCHIRSSFIAEGCIVNGATVTDSIVGIRSRVGHGTHLDGVLMMGADFYQTLEELERDREEGRPSVGVGTNTFIRRAIIDKNARIGSGVQIVNRDNRGEHDGDNHHIRDGIVIIPKDALIPDGSVI